MQCDRILEALHLEPLCGRVNQNGGRVFPNGLEFTLLIDLKSKARIDGTPARSSWPKAGST